MASQVTSSELRCAVRGCGSYFLPAALFSAGVNILYLASPIYMLQVYDRVVPSGSVPTLVMLTLALLLALFVIAALDFVRADPHPRRGAPRSGTVGAVHG